MKPSSTLGHADLKYGQPTPLYFPALPSYKLGSNAAFTL